MWRKPVVYVIGSLLRALSLSLYSKIPTSERSQCGSVRNSIGSIWISSREQSPNRALLDYIEVCTILLLSSPQKVYRIDVIFQMLH